MLPSFSRNVYALCLGLCVSRTGAAVVMFLPTYVTSELGRSLPFATSIIGAYGAGAIVGAALGGIAADRIGRRAAMVTSLVGCALAVGALGLSRSSLVLLMSSLCFGLFNEMFRAPSAAMLTELVEPDRRAIAFGLYSLAANLGLGAAALLGGALATRSFSWLFWMNATTSAVLALAFATLLPETQPAARDASPGLRECAATISRDHTFLAFSGASFLIGLVFLQSMSTLPLAMRDAGMAPDGVGRVMVVNSVLIVLLQLPVTSIVARAPRGAMVVLTTLLIGVGFGLHALTHTSLEFAGAVAVWTLGEIAHGPLLQAAVGDLAPEKLRGRYIGVIGMCFTASLMVGAPLGGWAFARMGSRTLWIAALALSAVSAAIFWQIRGALDRHSRVPD